MRSAIEASMPLPDQSFGMPKMPARNTSRIATITTTFQVRFLFMTCTPERRTHWSVPPSKARQIALFPFLCRSHRHHRRTGDFELEIIRGHAQGHRIVPQADDGATQASAGYNLVPVLQFAEHG